MRPLPDVAWDALIVNNTAIGVTLVPAGATVRLGTLTAAPDTPRILPGETIYPPSGEPAFDFSFLDAFGTPITGRIDYVYPDCALNGYPCGFTVTVPEVELSTAAALALALQLLGGKMRRRSGSVGAPT